MEPGRDFADDAAAHVTELRRLLAAMAHAEFEIWHYDPRLFAEKPLVDRLSLALSLESINDDRVQIAIDALLGSVPW